MTNQMTRSMFFSESWDTYIIVQEPNLNVYQRHSYVPHQCVGVQNFRHLPDDAVYKEQIEYRLRRPSPQSEAGTRFNDEL